MSIARQLCDQAVEPNKVALPNARNAGVENDTDASSAAMNGEAQQEASVSKEEGSTGLTTEQINKKNNTGNVPNGDVDEKEAEGSGTNGRKAATVDKRTRVARELDRLKIDAIRVRIYKREIRTVRTANPEKSGRT